MIAKKLHAIENEQDRDKLVNSLFDSVYWYRKLRNNEAADNADDTANIFLNDLIFEPKN